MCFQDLSGKFSELARGKFSKLARGKFSGLARGKGQVQVYYHLHVLLMAIYGR